MEVQGYTTYDWMPHFKTSGGSLGQIQWPSDNEDILTAQCQLVDKALKARPVVPVHLGMPIRCAPPNEKSRLAYIVRLQILILGIYD